MNWTTGAEQWTRWTRTGKRSRHQGDNGGQWTMACCGLPAPGGSIYEAIRRILIDEMAIKLQPNFAYKFMYNCALNTDFTQDALAYVYTEIFDGPSLNSQEVEGWKFMDRRSLRNDIEQHPDQYMLCSN